MQLIALFNAGRHVELGTRTRPLTSVYPDSGFVWKILGTVLLAQSQDGVFALEKAVALLPADVESHSNLGNALKDIGQYNEAIASFRRAIQLQPDLADAHNNLIFTLNYLPDQDANTLLTETKHYGAFVAARATPSTSWPNTPDADRTLRIGLVSGEAYWPP